MGLFGNSRPRSLMDTGMGIGAPSPFAAPQVGGMTMPFMPQQPAQTPEPRRNGLRTAAGVLGDALSQAAGGQARFLPQMMQERNQQRETQLRQQQQAEERAYEESQWRLRQDYQRDNPEPDAFMRALVAAGYDPNSEEGRGIIRQRVLNMADPLQTVNNGDGTFTLVRPSQLGGTPQPAAPAAGGPAVGTVRNGYRFRGGNPNDRASWEPVGGQTPPASGGFR